MKDMVSKFFELVRVEDCLARTKSSREAAMRK